MTLSLSLVRGICSAMAALSLLLSGCATVSPGNQATNTDAPGSNAGSLFSFLPKGDSRPGLSPLLPNDTLQPIQAGSTYSLSVTSLTPPTDIWDRIRRGFAMPDLEGDIVRDRTQWYSSRPDGLFQMAERSRKYLFYVVEELERRGMPTELALLPYVESAFNPHAVSSAKAAGMWQFMPATGKDFDLKQNLFRDDRRDVLASTRAALDYLQMLHGMFNDWHLALAAYNWGQGSVKKAIERNQKRGLPTGYEDLTMPMETRMYVPKLQAIKNIVANPAAYNARLPLIENHPFFDTVTLERDIDVALAAKLAEVDENDFRLLNPSSRGSVIFSAGTPTILLPWNNAITFKRNLQFHIGPLATLTAWAVPSNMRTADIARRFDMPESDLRSLNKIPPGMLVKAGSTLLVPRMGHTQADVSEHVADHGQLALQAEKVLRRSTVTAKKGETLTSLARRVKHDVDDLVKWNKLSASTALKAGQALVVFTEVSVAAAAPRRDNNVKHVAPQPSRKAVTPQPSRKQAPAPTQKSAAKPKK
jgi:membrane-bound lytic murein transglycosylase D